MIISSALFSILIFIATVAVAIAPIVMLIIWLSECQEGRLW